MVPYRRPPKEAGPHGKLQRATGVEASAGSLPAAGAALPLGLIVAFRRPPLAQRKVSGVFGAAFPRPLTCSRPAA